MVDKVVVDYVRGQMDCRVVYLGLEFQYVSGWWAGRQVDSTPPYLGSGSQNTTNYWILVAKDVFGFKETMKWSLKVVKLFFTSTTNE